MGHRRARLRPGVIDVDSVSEGGRETTGTTPIATPAFVACHTPDGAAVCLGRLVGDPDAESRSSSCRWSASSSEVVAVGGRRMKRSP